MANEAANEADNEAVHQRANQVAREATREFERLAAKLNNEGTIFHRQSFKEIRDGKACYGEHKRFEAKTLKGSRRYEYGKPSWDPDDYGGANFGEFCRQRG